MSTVYLFCNNFRCLGDYIREFDLIHIPTLFDVFSLMNCKLSKNYISCEV